MRTENGLFWGFLASSRILLENDPDCVKTRKLGYVTKKYPTNIVNNGIKWDITIK